MTTMDDETLRAILDGLRRGSVWITADRCQGDSVAVNAFCDLIKAAPALAAEVLRLRERAARADSDASGYLADHAAALLDLGAVRDAARAHLAADDALTLARRTDAADVPTAEARALAARECLAGLVGYAGEVGR